MSDETKTIATPRFLTAEMAELAVHTVLQVIYGGFLQNNMEPHREHLHVVVLVPGQDVSEDYSWEKRPMEPVILYQYSRGDPEKFQYEFDEIARCKAKQLWDDRNDDRTDIIPHLLFPGDTPFWGGVKRRGIVVTCSGLKPYLDKLISGMVADLLVAMAHAAWKNSSDHKEEVSFIS